MSHPTARHRAWKQALRGILLLLCLPLLPVRGAPGLAPGKPQDRPGRVSSWEPPLNLSQTTGHSTFPTIQRDAGTGDLYVAWTDYAEDAFGEIMLRRRPAAVSDWDPQLNLSNWAGRDQGAALYADDSGTVHLAWTRRDPASGTDIRYRAWDGTAWSDGQVLYHTDTYLPSSFGLLFARSAAGRTCLFATFGSGISSACQQEGAWDPFPSWVYVPGVGRFGPIVAGPDGLYHAAVFGLNEGAPFGCDPQLDDVYHATWDGSTWVVLDNLSGQGSIGYDAALAFDPQGRLHLMWSDNHPSCSLDSEKSALYERVLEGGTWGPRTELTTPNDQQAVLDLTLDRSVSGSLHLAWSEGLFDDQGAAAELSIRYRYGWGAGWGTEEIVWSSVEDSLNVEAAAGNLGWAGLVWEEGPSGSEEVVFSARVVTPQHLFLPWTGRASAPVDR